jgi:hypothetical protein
MVGWPPFEENMSNEAGEHIRDARRAHGEAAVSLSTIGDQLKGAQTALVAGDHMRAKRALDRAAAEVDAAHGYLAAARDSHQALGRCLNSAKVAA